MSVWYPRYVPHTPHIITVSTSTHSITGMWNTNWFSNVIYVPRLIGQACLLLSPSLTTTQFANCTHITGRSYSVFHRKKKPEFLAGTNTLDIASIGLSQALLGMAGNLGATTSGNLTLFTETYGFIHEQVHVQVGIMQNGILPDGSFSQHDGIIYNGNVSAHLLIVLNV